MIDKVGLIPIHNYLVILDRRCYCPSLAIEYTKEIYGVDITEEVEKCKPIGWDYYSNVYEKFNNDCPAKSSDDGSREYFTKVARPRYGKFYSKYKENDGSYDMIMDWCLKASVIHHIYPLCYGNDNSLLNLIPISDFHHEILHKNPLEHERKYCYIAVDYLSYMYLGDKFKELIKKYNINQYKDMDGEFRKNFLESVIDNEMKEFYKYIEVAHGRND